MPSPFPGMDPYLERPTQWEDFHSSYIERLKITLAGIFNAAGDKYRARSEAMLFAHEPPEARRRFGKADDAVVIGIPDNWHGGNGDTATLTKPTTRIRFDDTADVERHRYIEIRTGDDERVVTVIELLSPSNKNIAKDRAAYLQKREQLTRAGVNFLQIDLLRGGRRLLPQKTPQHHYNAMLVRGDSWEADVWLWSLRNPLPTLPLPLLKADGDMPLDLQALLDTVYDTTHLRSFLYRRATEPPLKGDDAAWAAGLLKEAGIDAAG